MQRRDWPRKLSAGLIAWMVVLARAAGGAEQAADDSDLFERKIRPVLVERCYECHSSRARQLEGSLSVETPGGLRKGGDQGPAIVPGEPEKSLLLRAIRQVDKDLQMPPPPGQRLSAETIADFETWIKRGAPDPRAEAAGTSAAGRYAVDIEAAKKQWPFTPPVEPAVPTVKDAAWPRNEIDHFILAKLEHAGLAPAPDADRRALVRRVTYDLIGLPPTLEDLHSLVAHSPPLPLSPSQATEAESGSGGEWERAFAAYVDRLLASPQYGERWGRHWLDVVRYADTAGDNSDYPIPQMYKYRNWVIRAINDGMPFDEFIRQQLAGDLLPAGSPAERHEKIIATGYIANARRFGSRVSDYPQHLTIEDTIDNLGRAFLGMSLSCARCHNHKFDPFTNDDYYALYGIFHSTRYPWPGIELEKKQRDLVPLVADDVVQAATAERKQQVERVTSEVKACEDAKQAGDDLAKALKARLEALKSQLAAAEDVEGAERQANEAQEQAARLDAILKAVKKKKTEVENTALPFEAAYAVAESKKIEDCKVHLKGDPERPGALVPRHFPVVFGGRPLAEPSASGRLELAEWIASPTNPLTARVLVNRLWHHHFGRGIVATPNDFGRQGKPPTHPELLDYLAVRFTASGWSLKAMHRLIVSSRAYQQSSQISDLGLAIGDLRIANLNLPHSKSQISNPKLIDPENTLLSHFRRRRLDAESLRDTLLVLGGNLDPSLGEGHPFPPQQAWDFTQHKPFKAVYDTSRRSVYLMTQRIQRHPLMAIFDGPDTGASTGSRITSTTTLQALYFLNDAFVHEQANRLAARLLASSSDDAARIKLAYELCYSREPTADELALGQQYLAKHDAPAAAWPSYVRVLLRTNEFAYLD